MGRDPEGWPWSVAGGETAGSAGQDDPETGRSATDAARDTPDRRGFLAAVGGALSTALAGCISLPGRRRRRTTETASTERPTTATPRERPTTRTTVPTTTTPPTTEETPTETPTEEVTPDVPPRTYEGIRTRPPSGVSIVDVVLQDGSIELSIDSVPPGRVLFFLLNRSLQDHEFLVIRTDRDPARLPTGRDGRVAESVLDVVTGYVLRPGHRRDFAISLPAGNYVVVCNLGRHYLNGEYTDFKVV